MNRKMAAMFVTMLIALSMVGVAYALWDKTLFIDGTVHTGEVNAEFTAFRVLEDLEVGGKDVGSTTVSIDLVDPQKLHIEILNGYPCYGATVYFTITNTGSIPVKVNGLTVITPDPLHVKVTFSGIELGNQIDADLSKEGSLYIHVMQDAVELETYYLDIVIWLVQWNEYPYP